MITERKLHSGLLALPICDIAMGFGVGLPVVSGLAAVFATIVGGAGVVQPGMNTRPGCIDQCRKTFGQIVAALIAGVPWAVVEDAERLTLPLYGHRHDGS